MGWVLLALLPALLVHGLAFGWVVLRDLALVIGIGLSLEALMLRLRQQPLRPYLSDLSAPVTAILLMLCLPPGSHWSHLLLGLFAALVLAKHAYGGLGHNLFNPAMVGYAVLLLCFPRELGQWPSLLWQGQGVDTLAGATPLDSLRTALTQGFTVEEALNTPGFPFGAAAVTPWMAAAYLFGGLILLWRGLLRWQTPAGVLLGIVAVSAVPWLLDSGQYASPLFHLLSGASLVTAFFIASDPVSGCTTPRGRWIFAFGVGALIIVIRLWGHYPDGAAFAVLLMNACAPWIDLHTRPRIVGET
ncbi:RnfABCDGE type electron transport complex subunit D [Pseudoxanthomonas sp. CAU 1598]|uniref:Ion-translocating oxidoreductase complex subunit D n=2 Tax=Pseudomarimonas arenosa TaxID=2774145 RepID=A0AAW3ZN91_9GAMM|nr:RnfABCDGE type electron transport complex subunit D [Pseudomarimonas arenosa]